MDKQEPAIKFTETITYVPDNIKKEFEGMNYRESVNYQLEEWVKGRALHNPIGNECCPDFSCCKPDFLMEEDLRIKFSNAIKIGDNKIKYEILGMALSGLAADKGKKVHIAGEDQTEH